MAHSFGHVAGWFVRLVGAVFRSRARWLVSGLLALLVTLLLAVSGLNVLNSYVGRDFMTALAERDVERFYRLGLAYVGVFALSTLVAVAYRFTEERLGLLWRGWLTGHLMGKYLAPGVRERLLARADIDNPDQRLTEDVKLFTTNTLSLLLILLNSSITLMAFCGVLWSIHPSLLVVAVLYAAVGSLVALLLGHRLVGLNTEQLKKEADFRYGLIRAREQDLDADPVAEGRLLQGLLGRVLQNMKRIIAVNRNLGFFTVGYNYLIPVLPIFVVAPLYFRGEVPFGEVTQSAMAFAHVLGAFSLLVVEFQRLSSFAAFVLRLGALREALDESVGGETPAPLPPAPAASQAALSSPAGEECQPAARATDP